MARQHLSRPEPDETIETPVVHGSPVTSTGIRELKDNLSRYIRRVEAGERIVITAMAARLPSLSSQAPRRRARPDASTSSSPPE